MRRKIRLRRLRRTVYWTLYASRLMYAVRKNYNSRFNNPVRILYTHRVIDGKTPLFNYYKRHNLTVEAFEKRIRFLTRHYSFVGLKTAIEYMAGNSRPANCVSLTFDDGYRDNFTNAYPILKKYGIPATIFLTTDCIGADKLLWHDALTYAIAGARSRLLKITGLGEFDLSDELSRIEAIADIKDRLKSLPEKEKNRALKVIYRELGADFSSAFRGRGLMMSWDQARQMQNEGLVFFGSHAASHALLNKISVEEARREILSSRNVMEKHLGKRVDLFSYPGGCYNEQLKSVVKEAGFIAACATSAGQDCGLFAIRRYGFDPEYFSRWIAWMFGLMEPVASQRSTSCAK